MSKEHQSAPILIFGAHGQLGHQLTQDLRARGEHVVAFGREDADITNAAQIDALFAHHQPNRVFNAAAYNAVDKAEEEPDAALAINAFGPAILARAAREHESTLVHFSTDYVFGNGHDAPINESHRPEPLGAYARSKFLGEEYVRLNCPKHHIVRCCGLYSPRRHNFIRTMLRVALAGKPLTVVDDQFVCPTWVAPLSHVAIELSEQTLYGTVHAVSHGHCSWFEYAQAIFEHMGLTPELSGVSQNTWAASAPRPEYSVLDNAMLRLMGLDHFDDWRVMLGAFLDDHGEAMIQEERPA